MEDVSVTGLRLSPIQKLVWSTTDLKMGSTLVRVLVEGELDVARLHACFEREALRHESLRTFFALSPGFADPFQIIRPEAAFS
jgi:hypothetical protein